MHAVVCVKQVPEQNSVKITPDKQIDASGINPIINLFDEYAIEEALLHSDRITIQQRPEWQRPTGCCRFEHGRAERPRSCHR